MPLTCLLRGQQFGAGCLLISPCPEAAEYLRRTRDRVAAQSVKEAAWVIVDGIHRRGKAILAPDRIRNPMATP
jgi:hypothetical protein